MQQNNELGMKIPEVELWKLLNIFKAYTVQDIVSNQSDYSKSFLWNVFGKNDLLENIDFGSDFNFYKQSVDIFIRKNRELAFSIGYNLKKASTPTIHIVLPGETPMGSPIGSNEGYQGFVENEDGTTSGVFNYSNRSTYNLIITSENQNEVVLLYHWLKACFGSMIEQLAFRGFQNPEFGGNDIGISEELVPNHIFYRNFNVNFTYEWSVKSINRDSGLPTNLIVSGNNIPTNPNNPNTNCPTLSEYLAIATGQLILSLLSDEQKAYIASQICGSGSVLDTIISYLNFEDSVTSTSSYSTLNDGVNFRPDLIVPSRQILNSVGQAGTNRKIDLGDLLSGTLPVALDVEVLRDGVFFAFKESGGTINVPSVSSPILPFTSQINDVTVNVENNPSGVIYSIPCLDTDGAPVGVPETLLGSVIWRVPAFKSLCSLISTSDVDQIGDCVRSAGKQESLLANMIPIVDPSLVVAQVYNPMTIDQKNEILSTQCPSFPVGDPILYDFGTCLWSGQVISYRSGDEANARSLGFYSYSPSIGSSTQKQFLLNWDTLGVNNVFGNTNRFTNLVGGLPSSSGERVFIDHSTCLLWYVIGDSLPNGVWNTAIDWANSLSFSGIDGFILPPIRVFSSLSNRSISSVLNYDPLLISGSIFIWSSTTSAVSTAQAFRLATNIGSGSTTNKTGSNPYGIAVKRWNP